MNHIMRKPVFAYVKTKDVDQLRSNLANIQHLCFLYIDSKSEISSLYLSSVVVQPGLCLTLSETPRTGFLTTWLICFRWRSSFVSGTGLKS